MHLIWLLALAGSSLGRTALAPRSGSGSSTPLKLPGDRVMIAINIICSPVDADGCAIPYPPNEFCMPPHTSCKQDYTYVFNADVPQDKADECRRLCGCSPISNVMRYPSLDRDSAPNPNRRPPRRPALGRWKTGDGDDGKSSLASANGA
ncbi:hypothetical protein VFPFJ_10542 [Purpureocillium lilacinum]|uniref:Uncharacterized protein n=1 Tax=Purpureocillium lilacinum TaxID=33203 RepID=A0A179GH49_PURLI|nr:hypothetical protein VFPFJ_10542 [Purpureocillium lilacinum]OAQ76760.1 hypothetical protein VFPFJ_10542 [Purpureocillium lilacinum]GJN72555.1 hypothetical protein PLICBS_006628 [Purpureocillium lilacinum]GJN83070.1 hypothetical protein PLIIFM63780_006616 [Purpureocillium lilacinum]